MQAKLTITTPTGDHIEKLIGNTAILGRGNVHVRIDGSPQVSRFHALLRCHNNHQYQIVDLGSRNGTFIGQTKVILPQHISDEAYLRLGGRDGVEIHLQQIWDEMDDEQAYMTMDASQSNTGIVMVCDIKGFSAWREKMSEDDLARKFGSWIRSLISVVQASGGVVDKFVRDAVLFYWQDDEAESAIENALQTAAQVVALGRATFWGRRDQPLEVNVLLHRGRMTLGMGGHCEVDAPASGPTINVAWQIESKLLHFDRPLILTQACVDEFPHHLRGCFESLGEVILGGSTPTIPLYAAEVIVEEDVPVQRSV